MRMCSILGCEKRHYGGSFCQMHYARNRRNGNPLVSKKRPNGTTKKWLTEVALTWDSEVCLIYPHGIGSHGYGEANIDGRKVCAHVFICEEKHGPKPTPDHEVAHSCRTNKACVNWRHVRWATRIENMRDKFAHGTINRGEAHGLAMLSRDDVLAIRSATGRQIDIGDQFGVSQQTVSDIKNRRRWAWLQS